MGEIKDARAIKPLIAALKDKEPYVQMISSQSLGKIGSPSVDLLIDALNDKNSSVRLLSAKALAKIRDQRVIKPLLAALKDNNLEIVAGAYTLFIRKGISGSEPILIESLNKYGTERMAFDFINCDNHLLSDAARKWADKHGYRIVPIDKVDKGVNMIRWGK